MTPATNAEAARQAPAVSQISLPDDLNDTAATKDAQAGKWLALLLYNCGARSLAETQAAFTRHPEWAAA